MIINNDTTSRNTEENIKQRVNFTPRKNISELGGTGKIRTIRLLLMTYEPLSIEKIFHAKEKI